MAKKSYNPLKMFGSWMGFVLGVFLYFNDAIIDGTFCPTLNHVVIQETGKIICSEDVGISIMGINYILFYAIQIIVLFLVGWGIHSLIRK